MSRRFLALWFAAVTASAMAFIVHLALRFENVRLGYEVGKSYQEQRRLFETRRLLSIETQTLRQVERIEPFARDVLQMEVPGPDRTLVVRVPGADRDDREGPPQRQRQSPRQSPRPPGTP